MNKRSCLYLLAVVGIGCVGFGAAQQAKIPPEVWEKAQTKGVVSVNVGLNVPWQPEGKLSQQDRLEQRKAIAAAQSELLAELAGTKHKIRRQFHITPGISLEVGSDALAVLERSARVIEVREVRLAKPSVEHSVPKKTP